MVAALFGWVLGAASPAEGLEPSRKVVAKVGKAAFAPLAELARQKLPTHLELPNLSAPLFSGTSKVLFDCPEPNGIELTLTDASLDLQPASLELTPLDGALGIAASVGLSGTAHVELVNGVLCAGTLSCDVAFALPEVSLGATLPLEIAAGRVASVGLEALRADLPRGSLSLEFSNCLLEHLSSSMIEGIAEKLIASKKQALLDAMAAKLPPMLEEQFARVASLEGEVSAFSYGAALSSLSISSTGLEAAVGIGLRYTGRPAVCLEGGAEVASFDSAGVVDAAALPASPLSVAVPTDLVRDALVAVWQSGLMCVDDSVLSSAGLDLSKLAAMVPGLPEGTQLGFSLKLGAPPMVGGDDEGNLTLRLADLRLALEVSPPEGAPSTVQVNTAFSVSVGLRADAERGLLSISLADLAIEKLEFGSGENPDVVAKIDPARLEVIVSDVILPMLQERLGQTPIAATAFGGAGVFVWVDQLKMRPEGLYVGVTPYVPPLKDSSTAWSQFAGKPAALVRAGTARFRVTGGDDHTPRQLLRYSYRLDGAGRSEGAYGDEVKVPVTKPGTHTLEIRAMDLNGNEEQVPLRHTFIVDDSPPSIEMLERPEPMLTGRSARLRFSARDDRSAAVDMSYSYRLKGAPIGDAVEVMRNVETTRFEDGQAFFELADLADGSYELSVLAYDEAGNVTSESVTFAVHSTGCSASGGQAASTLALVFFALAVVALRARRAVALARPRRSSRR